MNGLTPVEPQEDELLVVQYLQCGHVSNMRRSKVVEIIGTRQLDEIDSGQKLDAPILSSEHCEDCAYDRELRDRLNEEMDLGLPEQIFD